MGTLGGAGYIEAEDVRRHPFRVAVAPLPSLQAVLIDSVRGGRKGTPAAWRHAIRAQLRDQDYATLTAFVSPTQTLVPDTLLGLAQPPGETLKDGIERMIATPTDALLAEVELCRAGTGDGGWEELERHPARWLRRYVGTLVRAWTGFRPIWQRAQATLEREVERVGVATALDAQLELADGLLERGSLEGGRWCLGCAFMEGRMTLPDTGVVLMPLVAGHGGSIIDFAGNTIRRLAYPVPSIADVELDDRPAAALESLLGIPRAEILRALDRPTSIGGLAEALRAVPSAATHHVGELEAAGLVVRERSGRHVLVSRTARGEALLALYDEVRSGGGVVVDMRRRGA
jgi:DNA-binding transcriptional ArsR family regulator